MSAHGDSDSASLRAAFIHSSQLKLLLRRAQSEESGIYRSRCLSRLLHVAEYLEKSLEWVDGEPMAEVALALFYCGVDGISPGGRQ